MIENGLVTYAEAHSWLMSFEFSSVTWTALAIAFLTTVISFETTGIIYDILLGLKSRGVALIRNIHLLLLSRQSSPLAVFDAVLRQNWLTRIRIRLPRHSIILRDDEKVSLPVSVKLFLLLLVGPLFNILSIVMTLEATVTLTFSQAGFGGMALDFNSDFSVMETVPFTEGCRLAKLADANGIVSVAKFSLCHYFSALDLSKRVNGTSTDARVAVLVIDEIWLVVSVRINEWLSSTMSRATVETLNGSVGVRPGTHVEAQRRVAMKGIELVAIECGMVDVSTLKEFMPPKKGLVETLVAFEISCPEASNPRESVVRVHQEIGQLSTLVNAKQFQVMDASLWSPIDASAFYDGGRESFVTRRKRHVGLPILAIIAVILVIVRMVLKGILRNDVGEGLEKMIKDRLGMDPNHSLMRSWARKIYYHTERCAGKEPIDVVETDPIQ